MFGKIFKGHPTASTSAPRDVAEAERRVRGRGAREPDNWKRLADACADHGDLDGAFNAYRRYADLSPDDVDAALACGMAARKAGALPESLDYFSRALALAPERADAHTQYAKALDLAGLLEEAL
ncbi:MAG: tetratricopeptide repeat protein, partial [bacterium]